jgi:two-component system chemotaxis response regulator CheB
VVVTSTARRELVEGAFRAMDDGVVGVFPKPDVPEQWHELTVALREVARRVAAPPRAAPGATASDVAANREVGVEVIAVGASTGGPAALRSLLGALGGGRVPATVVVQHIADGFEEGLANWLAHDTGLDVRVAADGDALADGIVRIAPPGGHLIVGPERVLEVDRLTPAVRGHRPSVDVLFRSVAESCPRGAAAVLLTGMGSDGADGLVRMRRAGALTIVQSESTCTVYGMPRAGLERGGADLALAPQEIGRLLARLAGEPGR